MTEGRYESARKIYAACGVDTEKALDVLKDIPISVHCWQGDDVLGFEGGGALTGGIQTTGNYPGRASTPEQLMADIEKAFSMMPGKKRLNLHASYALLGEDAGKVDRDAYTYKYFEGWAEFAKRIGLDGIDFNPTFFSHARMKDGLTLSSPDEETRKFWVEHGKRSLEIAAELGKAFGKPCFVNIWTPDGFKDVPADRLSPRLRMRQSLDEILTAWDKDWVVIGLESKVFGIGVESYTVNSNEFCQNYAATRGICCLLDMGHYHPTEVVSDKIPSMLAFHDRVALHVSRPVRWDSDHVVTYEDELKEVAKEIVRNGAADRVIIGLDYFDASINRLVAWVTGQRSMEKALLYALTLPNGAMQRLQDEGNFTELLYMQEQAKLLPVGDVWAEYLRRQGMDEEYYKEAIAYERQIAKERA